MGVNGGVMNERRLEWRHERTERERHRCRRELSWRQRILVLLRHGQTVWSESGQHTGRTNIPLTAVGEQQAADAGRRLREAFPEGFSQGCVFSSPLKRACQTAELAGFADHGVLDGVAEWDYGRARGVRASR